MKIVKGICAFVGACLYMFLLLIVSILIIIGVSVCVLWGIDALCGTDFYTWKNVGVLSVVLFVFTRARSGKN